MDNSDETHESNSKLSVKKRNISIGIISLALISSIIFLYPSNLRAPLFHWPVTVQINKSIQLITSTAISTTSTTTTTTTKSKINSTSKLITTTTRQRNITTTINIDEILCDNLTEFGISKISQNPCERLRCTVVLRRSGGRLGNRMFMFASAYGLARTHNCRLSVAAHIRNELSNNFQMKLIDENMWLSESESNRLTNIEIKDTVCSFLPELMRPNAFRNIELLGYWQSYLHFDAHREEIRDIFSARNGTLIRLAQYLTEITRNICSSCSPLPNTTHRELRQAFQTRYNITWISIHIRRSDFRGLGYSSEEQYIRRAILSYRRRYYQEQVRFLVASDDRGYCRQIFAAELKSNRIIILPENFSPADDLMALSLCRHSILTGGTFGFWAAYLAGGEVIHDIKYKTGCSRADYYPPWFLLVGEVQQQQHKS